MKRRLLEFIWNLTNQYQLLSFISSFVRRVTIAFCYETAKLSLNHVPCRGNF